MSAESAQTEVPAQVQDGFNGAADRCHRNRGPLAATSARYHRLQWAADRCQRNPRRQRSPLRSRMASMGPLIDVTGIGGLLRPRQLVTTGFNGPLIDVSGI